MAVIGPVQLRVMWPISCQNCQRLKDHLRNRGLPNVRFWILNSGISWCRLNDEKILYASVKKIAGPHVFFIQILIIWQKKDEEKGGRGFYISFFYSLNKSIVLRLTEHCWDVNRGQTNCRYCYYSDRSYMAEGKVVRLILCTVSLAVRGSQSTFSASNFQLTLLSLDAHPPAKTSRFLSQRLTRKR